MATHSINAGDVNELVRWVIDSASGDTIELAAGTYDLDTLTSYNRMTDSRFRTPGGASNNINGLPVITKTLTIRGLGSTPAGTVITRPGTTKYRLIFVAIGNQLTLENLTLTNGEPANLDYSGGGVYNKGTLNVNNCIMGPNNKANYGGGIRNDGTATIDGCEIVGNTTGAGGRGGGIYGEGANTTVSNSVLRNNNGPNGGALMNAKSTAVMTVEDCIIKDNIGVYGGGIACYAGSISVSGCTIYGNHTNSGALHTRGSGTQITAHNNNLFDNRSGSNPSVEAWTGSTIDAQANWWGRPDGPAAGEVVGAVDVSEHKLNPVLSPAYLSWMISPPTNSIRRGPSSDDLLVPFGNLQVPVSVCARAIDEDGATWYSFEHPDRTDVLSWVLSTDAPLPDGYNGNELPKLNTQSNEDYSDSLVTVGAS